MSIYRKTLSSITSLMDKRILTYYRDYCKKKKIPKRYKVDPQKDLRKILNLILLEIRDSLINSDSGVCIDKLGYFFIFRTPQKIIYEFKDEEGQPYLKYGNSSGKRDVMPLFLPYYNNGNRVLYGWSMDKTYTTDLCRMLYKKLEEGDKYKCYPYTLKKLKRI